MDYKVGKVRKHAVATLVTLLWCLDGAAADTPYVYPFNIMTAAELVQKLTTEPASPQDSRESDRAHYYLAGIKDGTQGVLWCFKRAMLPVELNYEIAHALKERYKAEELNANAALLVLAELRRRYPCSGMKGRNERPRARGAPTFLCRCPGSIPYPENGDTQGIIRRDRHRSADA